MAVENTRKLKMMFKTSEGDDRNVTLNYVKDGLKTGEGAEAVHAAMLEVVSSQPLDVEVASIAGAQVVETTTTDVTF